MKKTEKAHGCASLPFLADFNFTGSVFEWPFETVHAAGGGRAALQSSESETEEGYKPFGQHSTRSITN